MYTALRTFIHAHIRVLIILTIIGAGVAYYFYTNKDESETVTAYTVVDTVKKGNVSSGIYTTGKVIVAEKLDLDVYKQLSRIDVVNVANGGHVEMGDVLVSFDKSDAYTDAESARVSLVEAELALRDSGEDASDPNTALRTLQDTIASYRKSIEDATQDIQDAYQDFLNEDLEVAAHEDDEDRLASRTEPTVGGRYVGTKEGRYVLEVYASSASTGYSLRLSGLESDTATIYPGTAIDIGTRGLTVNFPSTLRSGDTWVIEVPNVTIATYGETKRDYERTVADLEKSIASTKVKLANAAVELADLERGDARDYRNLDVEKARASVSSAREKLSEKYDVIHERDIVAPFSGTIQDMENVVVGATPTGGTEDTINLGTLISDEFLTTFTLSATDVAKVEVGQKVKVTITSFSEQPIVEGVISEISALPASSGVAQYEVLAKLMYDPKTAGYALREGVLADIEIVEEEKSDVLRIPVSAVTYTEGKAMVDVVDTLTDTQKKQVERLGIVKTDGVPLASYAVEVTLGIRGQYYVEVVNGLTEGSYIISTKSTSESQTSVVNQEVHVPGSGMRSGGTGTPPPQGE